MKTKYILPALILLALSFASPAKRYPSGCMPMWSSQKGGHEVLLLNVNNIVIVKPIAGKHLEVRFTDGSKIEVYEDFDEFKSRMIQALK